MISCAICRAATASCPVTLLIEFAQWLLDRASPITAALHIDLSMRVVFRTHYQAVGTLIYDALLRIVSPVEARSRAEIADTLSRRAPARINAAAGGYAVDAGVALGLLTERITLQSRAASYQLAASLDRPSRGRSWFYLRALVKRDGAVMLELLRFMHSRGEVTLPALFEDSAVDILFLEIFRYYFLRADDLYERDYLRTAVDRLERDGFMPKTRKHKLMFHLIFMRDLGLIAEFTRNGSRVFTCTHLGERFVIDVGNLDQLERLCSLDAGFDEWIGTFEMLAPVDVELKLLLGAYRAVEGLGVRLLPVDSLQCAYAFMFDALVSRESIVSTVIQLRTRFPNAVYLYGYGGNPHDGVRIDLSQVSL